MLSEVQRCGGGKMNQEEWFSRDWSGYCLSSIGFTQLNNTKVRPCCISANKQKY